jgi:CRP/FNR family transcriptional regulator
LKSLKKAEMPEHNLINSCENCSNGWKNFKHLTETELQLINGNRYEATFKPGEIMIKQGSPTSSALFMSRGMAKIYVEGIRSKNFIIELAQPGGLIMGPGGWVNSRHTYSVSAITSVQACFINFDIFKQLVKTNGAFAENLLEDISEKAFSYQTRMVNQAQKRMSGRLAEILLYFADEVFMNDEYEMVLSRQELGEMTSMAKECVVRILKELEDSGLIYSDTAKIKILNKDKLIQVSEKG